MKEFDLTYKKRTFVRWNNWKDFVESIDKLNYNFELNNANGGVALFFLTYNLSDSVIKLLSKLNEEKDRNSFDIIVVDNHSKDAEFFVVKDFINKQNIWNVILIRTTDNLWWAWWNAIAMEYILSKEYKYLIFTEDDAFPLSENLVSKMIERRNPKWIVRTIYSDIKSDWNFFHFTLFPINFIKLVWVPNPSYFMRADDWDFIFRCEKIVKDYGYQYIYSKLEYIHPFIKKWAWKYWWTYFSIRNAFQSKMTYFMDVDIKYAIKDIIIQYCILFAYIWTAFSKFFIEKQFMLLKAIIFALHDFIFWNLNYKNNKDKLSNFWKYKNDTILGVDYKRNEFNIIDKNFGNFFMLDKTLNIIYSPHKIKYSNKISDFFNNGCIITSYNLPLYPIIFLSPNVISIEEFSREGNRAFIGVLRQHKTFINIILVIVSFILSVIPFTIYFLILTIKIILFKITRLLWK